MSLLRAPQRVGTQFIAQLAVVGERAKGEMVPQPVVAELRLGPPLQVPGEKPLGHGSPRFGGIEDFPYPWEHARARIVELAGQNPEIGLEITGEIPRRGVKAEFRENLADDPRIRAPGEVDVVQQPVDAKTVEQSYPEGAHAGSAGGDKGPVDVPADGAVGRARARAGHLRSIAGDALQCAGNHGGQGVAVHVDRFGASDAGFVGCTALVSNPVCRFLFHAVFGAGNLCDGRRRYRAAGIGGVGHHAAGHAVYLYRTDAFHVVVRFDHADQKYAGILTIRHPGQSAAACDYAGAARLPGRRHTPGRDALHHTLAADRYRDIERRNDSFSISVKLKLTDNWQTEMIK